MRSGRSGKSEDIKRLRNENARLERENVSLRLKLKRAEGLIALQKKIAQMMEQAPDDLSAGAQAGSKGAS